MAAFTIVADIMAKADQIDLVKAELTKLIAPSRADAGCVQYDLHQDNENPAHFLFFENWESRALWQQHMSAPHLDRFRAATDGAIAALAIYEMTQIG